MDCTYTLDICLGCEVWKPSFDSCPDRRGIQDLCDGSTKAAETRVSSKQSNFSFGSDRNEPKLNLFRLFFGLFRETKQIFFRFVSVFRTGIETTKTN